MAGVQPYVGRTVWLREIGRLDNQISFTAAIRRQRLDLLGGVIRIDDGI